MPALQDVLRSPVDFARLLTISDMDSQLVRLNYKWAQLHYLANRTRRDIILKSRQEGFSTAIQAEAFRYCMTRRINIVTLMDIGENTEVMRRKQDTFYKEFPAAIIEGEPYAKPSRDVSRETMTKYSNGAIHKMATAGRLNVSRGDSLNMVHLSEAAYYNDLHSVLVSTGQAGKPFWFVVESTANGAQGEYHDMVMIAHESPELSDFKLHFYPWYLSPANRIPLAPGEVLSYTDDELQAIALYKLDPEQIKFRRQKQRETGYKFPQEYPESVPGAFISSVIGYFGPMIHNWGAPFGATRQPGVRYRMGIDWGQDDDYTVGTVWRTDIPIQVDIGRWRKIPYADMRRNLRGMMKKWGVELAMPEANSMGTSQIEDLAREIEADGLDTVLVPITVGTNKPDLVMSYNEDLQAGAQLLPLPEQKAEHLGYTARQTSKGYWTYGAPVKKGAHDDTVMANILARRAMHESISRVAARISQPGDW